MQVTLSEKKIILYNIKMCMIYEQCNYSILLLLYDFEMENVEIKQTNLKHQKQPLKSISGTSQRLFFLLQIFQYLDGVRQNNSHGLNRIYKTLKHYPLEDFVFTINQNSTTLM